MIAEFAHGCHPGRARASASPADKVLSAMCY
jgi:hypothetical protein